MSRKWSYLKSHELLNLEVQIGGKLRQLEPLREFVSYILGKFLRSDVII